MNETIPNLVKLVNKIPLVGKYLTVQFVVYVFVGGFTTGLDFFMYWFLVEFLHMWYLIVAATISPLTLLLNYSMHRRFTFKSTGSKTTQIPKYIGLVIFNYFAGLACLYILVDLIGINYLVARMVLYLIVITWNYAALRFVVFK